MRLLKTRGAGVRQYGLVLTAGTTESLHEPGFDSALRAGVALDPQAEIENIRARVYNFISYLGYSLAQPGDILQIGVSYGKFMRTALEYFGERLDRDVYLVDPWELAPGSNDPGGHRYCHDHKAALANLRNDPRAKPVVGFAPSALDQITSERLCFVHMNVAIPDVEIVSLAKIYDRVVGGGAILIDHFAWQDSHAAEQRYMQQAEKLGGRFISLLTGQGLLIKPA